MLVVSKNTEKYGRLAQYFAGIKNEDEEIAAANYPKIREFRVPPKTSETIVEDVPGKWQICSPETVPGFSAGIRLSFLIALLDSFGSSRLEPSVRCIRPGGQKGREVSREISPRRGRLSLLSPRAGSWPAG